MTGVDRAHFVSGDENPETDAFVDPTFRKRSERWGTRHPAFSFVANLAGMTRWVLVVYAPVGWARGIEVLADP